MQTTNSQHDDPIAANVLDRDCTAAAPNQRWVGDTTEFAIGEHAKLYLAAILDPIGDGFLVANLEHFWLILPLWLSGYVLTGVSAITLWGHWSQRRQAN